MSFANEIFSKQLNTRVSAILKRSPQSRDSDKKLWLIYCDVFLDLEQAILGGPDSFRSWILSKEVPTFETITRSRRKLQAQYPELRGSNYKQKKIDADFVRQNIKNME